MAKPNEREMTKMRNIKIKYKLPVFVMILAVIPLLIVSMIAMRLNSRSALGSSMELLKNQAEASVRFLGDFYGRQADGLIYASNLQMYVDYLTALENPGENGQAEAMEMLRRNIEDIQRVAISTDNRIDQIMLLDRQGTVAASPDQALVGTKLKDLESFDAAMKGQSGSYEVVREKSKEPMLLMGQPVKNSIGQVLGVIVRRIDLKELREYVENLRIGKNGTLFVLDGKGEPVAYGKEGLLTQIKQNQSLIAFSKKVSEKAVPVDETSFEYSVGSETLEAFARTENTTGWAVVAAMPQSEIYEYSLMVNHITLWVALAAGMLALIVGLVFAHGITAPLSELTENLNAIADGKMNYASICKGRDELAEVCSAANLMSHKLQVSYNKLAVFAKTDMLTGLLNRAGVYEVIAHTLDDRAQAAILLDLDGFKAVNDNFGHDSGDDVLVSVAAILKQDASETVYPARLGGDEFLLYFSHYDTRQQVIELGGRILEQIASIHTALGNSISVSASIGVAFSSEEEPGREILIKKADHAMYQVKQKGKSGVLVFENALLKTL